MCDNIGLKTSNFWQMEVPEQFINKTFGELFDEFCDKNLIALGLYRLPGARDNNTSYVYTKPSIDTKISHRDKVFVLAADNINSYFFNNNNSNNNNYSYNNINGNNNNINNIKDINEKLFGGKNNNYFGEDFNKINGDNENENNDNTNPFYYIKNQINDIEKEVDTLDSMLEGAKNTIHESVASGIKQEIISLLK